MLALDLFCGAGGASKGLSDAGYDVVGVDLSPQKRYPYPFEEDCALRTLQCLLKGQTFYGKGWGESGVEFHLGLRHIDLIWASPPCQFATEMNNDKSKHEDLITPTRELLEKTGKLWVIENVEGARQYLRDPVALCGSMFGLGVNARDADGVKRFFQLQRHRLFETNFPVSPPAPCSHTQPTIGVYGGHARCRSGSNWRIGGADFPDQDKGALARRAMGIDWMTLGELSEAIPPAYSMHIGLQAKAEAERRKAK